MERDRTRVGLARFQPRLLDQKGGNDPVNHLQFWREQLRLGSEQNTAYLGLFRRGHGNRGRRRHSSRPPRRSASGGRGVAVRIAAR